MSYSQLSPSFPPPSHLTPPNPLLDLATSLSSFCGPHLTIKAIEGTSDDDNNDCVPNRIRKPSCTYATSPMDLLPHLPSVSDEGSSRLREALDCQHAHSGAGVSTLAWYVRHLLCCHSQKLASSVSEFEGDALEILDALAFEPILDLKELSSRLAHADPGDFGDPAKLVAEIIGEAVDLENVPDAPPKTFYHQVTSSGPPIALPLSLLLPLDETSALQNFPSDPAPLLFITTTPEEIELIPDHLKILSSYPHSTICVAVQSGRLVSPAQTAFLSVCVSLSIPVLQDVPPHITPLLSPSLPPGLRPYPPNITNSGERACESLRTNSRCQLTYSYCSSLAHRSPGRSLDFVANRRLHNWERTLWHLLPVFKPKAQRGYLEAGA